MEANPKKLNRWLLLTGGSFAATIILLLILSLLFGVSYKKTLSNLIEQPHYTEITTTEVKKIKKVTFQKQNTASCIEITPDGIVRIFSICGEKLDSADRLTQIKNINKLFQLLREKKYNTQEFSGGNEVYQVVVETEAGTEIFYIVVGSGGQEEELLEILEDIQEDIPHPTFSTLNPVASGDNISPSPTAVTAASQNPYATSSPTPTVGPVMTFTCEFTEGSTSRRPYNVSNIICTSEPSPVP